MAKTRTPTHGPPWQQGQMVRDGDWLMIATKQTSQEPPGPRLQGTPEWGLSDTPGFATSQDPGSVYTGNRFTLSEVISFIGARVWYPTWTADYTATAYAFLERGGIRTNLSSVRQNVSPETGQWNPVAGVGGSIYYPGDIIEVGLLLENLAGATDIVNSEWDYQGTSQGADPSTGGWNTNNQNTLLRINQTDGLGGDQSAALAAVVVGDVFVMTNAGGGEWRYTVNSDNGAGGGVHTWGVTRTSDAGSMSGATDIRVSRSGSTTDFAEATNYWSSNTPPWTSAAQGTIQVTEGGSPTFNNNGYGIDLLADEWTTQTDWDILARSFT